MSQYQNHPDPAVQKEIIALSDALCQHERATGIESVIIVRDSTGFVYRAVNGKPGIPGDIPDQNFFDMIAATLEKPED